MTLLYRSPFFRQHRTGQHPENALRLETIDARLDALNLPGQCETGEMRAATVEEVVRLHRPEYVESVREFVASGGGRIESDTVCSPQSWDVALAAVQTAIAAVDAVRPPRALRRNTRGIHGNGIIPRHRSC